MTQLTVTTLRSKWSGLRIALIIFVLAFVVRLCLMFALHPYDQTLRVEIQHLAYSIAGGHGYGNPYPTPTGPSALYSPGCPLVLAGIYSIFGNGRAGEAVTCIVDIAVASAVFALMPLLSNTLGLSHRVGVIAALAGAIFPVYLMNEFHSSTAVFGAIALIGLTWMTAWAWNRKQPPSARLGALFGLAWGVGLLFSPNLLLVGLLWLLAVIVHYRAKALNFALIVPAVTLAVLSPWAIRNQLVLGSPIFTRSNLGLELWIANNDVSAASYGDNSESHTLYQPFINPLEADRLRNMGEVGYMNEKLDAAITWIERHPQRFTALTGKRIFRFWFPITFRPIQTVVICGLSFAALAGLAFAYVRKRGAFLIVGAIWLAYPLVYYLVQLDNPYRYPFYWSILLFAVYGCSCSIDALRSLRQKDTRASANRTSNIVTVE